MAKALTVKILGDAKGLKNAADEADGVLGKLGKSAGVAFAAAGVAIGGAAVVLGKWTKAAADDQGEQALFERQLKVAGGNQQVIDSFDSLIEAGMKVKGFTDTDLRNAYAQAFEQTGDLAKSQDDVALAMDIARRAGVPLEQAMDAISKANAGQTRALGTLLPQYKDLVAGADSSQEALDLLAGKVDGAADAFGDTMAGKMERAQIMLDETKESVGAALIPAMEALLPVVEKGAEWLGENLPVAIEWLQEKVGGLVESFREHWPAIRATIEDVVAWLRDEAWPVIQQVWDAIVAGMAIVVEWVQEHWPQIRDTIADVLEGVKQVIDLVVKAITFIWENWGDEILQYLENTWNLIAGVIEGALEIVRGIIKTVTSLIRGDWDGVWDGIKLVFEGVWDTISSIVTNAIDTIKLVISGAWETIKTWTSDAWDTLKGYVSDGIDGIIDTITGLPGDVANAAAGAFDAVWDAFKDVANKIIDGWNGLEFSLPEVDTHIPGVGKVGGWTIGTPNIPRFHSGGITDFGAAGEGLALLRNREMIIPTDDWGDARSTLADAGVGGPLIGQLIVSDGRNIHDELRLVEALYGQAA